MWVQSAVGLNGLLHGFYAFSSTSLRPTTRTRSTNEGQCQCVGWEGQGRNSGRGDPRALPASGCCDRSFAPQSSSVSLCRRPLPLQRVIRGPSSSCYWYFVSNHYRSSKVDSRSIFNFLIEPWWCLVPRIVRWSI